MGALALQLSLSGSYLDATPGGSTDIWLWEAGDYGMMWEAGIYIQLN